MKAIILAAGMGTRLGSLVPKPLTELKDGVMIFDYQVERLAKAIGRHSIIAVVGYKKELLMERHPDLLYVYNQAYATTNTAKSLLCGIVKCEDDVIWLNGDVYVEPAGLARLIDAGGTAALVNRSECGEEEIKYDISEDGAVRHLSKTVAEPLGEAVGINRVSRDDRALLAEELDRVDPADYFEKALENLTLSGKISLRPVYLEGLFCREIDYPEDLAAVLEHISGKSGSLD